MSPPALTVLRDAPADSAASTDGVLISHRDLKRWVLTGTILGHLFRYGQARLVTQHVGFVPRPFLTACALRLVSRGPCYFEDHTGRQVVGTIPALARLGGRFVRDAARVPVVMRRVSRELARLESARGPAPARGSLRLERAPLYLRTDLVFGLQAGGSVAHITGVLNHLGEFTGPPVFVTTDTIPGVRADIATHIIVPRAAFWDFQKVPEWNFNLDLARRTMDRIGAASPAFVYQRYSLSNYVGVALSRAYRVPLLMEYNGSELWINRHWGTGDPMKYERLAERAELLCLSTADVVVAVSAPMREELVGRGIDPASILVNPNGVDPEKYSPHVDGAPVRQQYALNGKTVIGFIGTFGKWHGAEVLAEAVGQLLAAHPEYRFTVRLLMVGDGAMMPEVKRRLAAAGMTDLCVLPGVVPQAQAPQYLAACDILVSPHVPNPDGTPFFGSPTKLFEYMAMGKGIVASALGQIGEVLEHGKTAWLVPPGDTGALSRGLKTLVDDRALAGALGEAARQEAVAKYTWREHTRRIIDKLVERCG